MRKITLWGFLAVVFFIWLFTDNIDIDGSNRPIKTVTKTTALQLFGKRTIWKFDKTQKQYNAKGQLLTESLYEGSRCNSKYVYTYTKFDSLQKTIWLTGPQLQGQRIDVHIYDSLNRLHKKLVYQINQIKADTFLEEQYFYFYNHENKITKTIHKLLNKRDTSTTTSILTYSYNGKGFVDTKFHSFYSLYIPNSTSATHYTYDPKGHMLAELEENGDSIYYIRNGKGQLIEKQYHSYPLISINRYWYDDRGNQIKANLDIDEGRTYKYIYNRKNWLIKAYNPGSILFLLKSCELYDYEYY